MKKKFKNLNEVRKNIDKVDNLLVKLIASKTNSIISGRIPIKTIKDNNEECGSKNDSGLLITISPYN